MKLTFDTNSLADYRTFLKIKSLPIYSMRGRVAEFPDEYASLIVGDDTHSQPIIDVELCDKLFDYQWAIALMAIQKKRFAVFADCGLGKTLIFIEFAKHAARATGKPVLIVSPLMVVQQTIDEAKRFYPDLAIKQVRASGLSEWLNCGEGIAITNYEAITDSMPHHLGCIILDESSMLKSHYGKWGTRLIEMGRGVEYKLCCTGTPAPNDRIEYANHAVFLDAFTTVNAFLATYFINRGQTQERWALKSHALKPFYKALSHWSIFLTDPSVYGWSDNCETLPPINVHIHDVDLTNEQQSATRETTGQLFVTDMGGITTRAKLGQLAKGRFNGKDIPTNKPGFIKQLIESWPDESTIVWCVYNDEQKRMERALPDAGSITGDTPHEKRQELVDAFKSGELKTIISKPKILGFGLNLQIATRQVFSGLQDSYEQYYQAVKRSNRYGSTKPLNVHIPVTELEEPMVANVLRKAHRVDADTREQQDLFRTGRGFVDGGR